MKSKFLLMSFALVTSLYTCAKNGPGSPVQEQRTQNSDQSGSVRILRRGEPYTPLNALTTGDQHVQNRGGQNARIISESIRMRRDRLNAVPGNITRNRSSSPIPEPQIVEPKVMREI